MIGAGGKNGQAHPVKMRSAVCAKHVITSCRTKDGRAAFGAGLGVFLDHSNAFQCFRVAHMLRAQKLATLAAHQLLAGSALDGRAIRHKSSALLAWTWKDFIRSTDANGRLWRELDCISKSLVLLQLRHNGFVVDKLLRVGQQRCFTIPVHGFLIRPQQRFDEFFMPLGNQMMLRELRAA